MSLYDELLKAENKSYSLPKLLDKITISKDHLNSCTFELTPFCNFNCSFCYARKAPEELEARGVKPFGFTEWKRYIDELAEMNCLTLVITGGECTIHPDFVKIYDYAYDKGLLINVFTNGSHITDEIIETWRMKPPSRIYITVYGDSPETYEKVTGRADCCDTVKRNIEKLVSMHLDVIIQGTFSSDNLRDAEKIFDFAHSLGCEFRYTTQLNTFGNCTTDLAKEIKADEELTKEINNNIWFKKRGLNKEDFGGHIKKKITPITPDPNAVGIKCNAGKNSCFINAEGIMMACNAFDAYTVDTKGRTLRDCFRELNGWAHTVPRIKECEGCVHAFHCMTCIALHYNDTHVLGIPSPRVCFKITHPEEAARERKFFEEHGYLEI